MLDLTPPKPIWSHGLVTFAVGSAMHLFIQQLLSNLGPMKWVDGEPSIGKYNTFHFNGNFEIPFKDEKLGVAGHCDALTRPLKEVTQVIGNEEIKTLVPDESGDRYIIDIKTITAREKVVGDIDYKTGGIRNGVWKKSSFEWLYKPKKEHVAQASLYAYLSATSDWHTDRLQGPLPKIPKIMIVYLAKDLNPDYYSRLTYGTSGSKGILNSPYKVFTQSVSKKTVDRCLEEISEVNDYVSRGELAPRDFHHTPTNREFACIYCDYNRECYRDEGYFSSVEEEDNDPYLKVLDQRLESL